MSVDIELHKAQIKIISGGALGSGLTRFLPKLIKPATSVLKNVVAPLGLSAGMSGIDGAIQEKKKKYIEQVVFQTLFHIQLIFSNEEINDMVKIKKVLEDADVLIKGVSETLKNYAQKGGALPILPMLLGTLGVSLLSGKGLYRAGSNKYNCDQGMHRAGEGKSLFRAGQGMYRAGQEIKKKNINATTLFNEH